MQDTGNTGSVVRTVRLKFPAAQALLEGQLLVHAFIDRVCLVAVCHDRLVAQHTNRCIDDQARILQLGWVKRLCADTLALLYEHAVAGVAASAHNKIRCYRLFSVRSFADDDTTSRIVVVFQFFRKI